MHAAHSEFIQRLITKSGPDADDFLLLDDWFARIHAQVSSGALLESDLFALRDTFGDAMSPETLQGFVCARPHGFAGDFQIIDRIYLQHMSLDPHLTRWDAYFQSRAAPQAVRNRKRYFHDLLDRHALRSRPLRVLKLASGPGRSMFEWLSLHPNADVSFHCIELDTAAIEHAQQLNHNFLSRIEFQRQNAIRFRPHRLYDLIWAAGLFDYFTDRVFQSVLRRMLPAIAPGGELVIGNFSAANPSRAYMEFGGWHLHHRTAEALVSLALSCGVPTDRLRVGAEAQGVNLFLHIAS